ncbi:hypothetical protein [Nocardia bovistercoris]|uniref:Uncharacterized protein n=1 Tax=Nocardia bovistercoris TaxID=2785916 RepID=A0A931N2M0_9NOCA|nr:hypothetical protein [Nocardia bovistercoris]MBH0779645.1 hypothetical protein [Nocardia bovistercoris]
MHRRRAHPNAAPHVFELRPGDIVLLPAAGARVSSGCSVEVLGVYRDSTPLPDGRVLAPEGPPDVVVLRAPAPGDSTVRLTTGDPFRATASRELSVIVR